MDFYYEITVNSSEPIYPTGVVVTCGNTDIKVGGSTKAYARILGGSGTITWSSSSSCVSLSNKPNSSCTVTGISAGSAKITATTNNGYTDYVYISVEADPISISLDCKSKDLKVGESFDIKASISGYNTTYCQWKTSNASVASVSGTGKTAKITALSPGTATITATADDGNKATCIVTVTEAPKVDLYVVGNLTDWEFIEDFKFTPNEDGSKYTLYLDYLSGEFKISSNDWSVNYGTDEEFSLVSLPLVENGNNIHLDKILLQICLEFSPKDKNLSVRYEQRPFLYWSCVNLLGNLGGGVFTVFVPEGARFPFVMQPYDENWKFVDMICDSDEHYQQILYDKENNIYVTGPVDENGLAIGGFYEKIDSGVSDNSIMHRAKVVSVPGGVSVEDIPENVTINLVKLNGENQLLRPAYGKHSLKIMVPTGEVIILKLSNGQEFKLVR